MKGIAFLQDKSETMTTMPIFHTKSLVVAALPGPTRKRTPTPYCYRLTYRNPDPAVPGCSLLWDVLGGRLRYQIALERETDGQLRWHCTCADAIYRGETEPNHVCKHVRGLLNLGRPHGTSAPACCEESAA
jgi:hypothetical protein